MATKNSTPATPRTPTIPPAAQRVLDRLEREVAKILRSKASHA